MSDQAEEPTRPSIDQFPPETRDVVRARLTKQRDSLRLTAALYSRAGNTYHALLDTTSADELDTMLNDLDAPTTTEIRIQGDGS